MAPQGNDGAIRTFATGSQELTYGCEFLPPNTLTLSCKPPHLPAPPRRGGCRRLTRSRREGNAAAVTPCSSSRPRRLGRRASGPAVCQLVRAVRRFRASQG